MSRRTDPRTLIALLLITPMFAGMLGVFGCLHVPIGDPETSKPHPALNGAWITRNDDAEQLYVFQTLDSRVHLLRQFNFKRPTGVIEPESSGVYRAWVTPLGGTQFLTIQPLFAKDAWGESDKPKLQWIVGKFKIDGAHADFHLLRADHDALKQTTTRQEAEAAIIGHINEPNLFADKQSFRRISRDEAVEILSAFKVE
jgi:hypothetical protein